MRPVVVSLALFACASLPSPKSMGRAARDCVKHDQAPLVAELVPVAVAAIQAATSLDGTSVDTGQLLPLAAKALSPVARCVWATSFATLAKPQAPPPEDAPQAAPFVVDRAAVLSAFERLRPSLGGDRFITSEGDL